MKRYLALSLTLIIWIFTLTACTKEYTAHDDQKIAVGEPQISEGDIQIICTTLTNSLIQLEYVNNSSINWGFGLEPYFQKITDGEWTDVPPITDIEIPEIWAELPADGGQNSQTLKLSEWYGDLPDGHYRAGVKLSGEAGEQMLWYEFEIDTIID